MSGDKDYSSRSIDPAVQQMLGPSGESSTGGICGPTPGCSATHN